LIIFDSSTFSVGEMKNLAFARKITAAKIRSICGDIPFGLYGFQENDPTGTTVNNEEGTAAADMTLSNAGMWSGGGWYAPHQGGSSAGMRGYGLHNDGGTSGYYGEITDSTAINVDGQEKATWIVIFKADSAGEGGFGRLFDKNSTGFRLNMIAANTLAMDVWDAAVVKRNTIAGIVYEHWHVLVAVYDGTQAGDTNRLKLYLNGIEGAVSSIAGIPATLTDPGNSCFVLEQNAAGTRAWDGQLGALAIVPDYAMSATDAADLVELRGLFQPTVANQFAINTPGAFNAPDYSAVANSRMVSYQKKNFDGMAATTILGWFSMPPAAAADNTYRAFYTHAGAVPDYRLFFWRSGLARGVGAYVRSTAGDLHAWEGTNAFADNIQRFYAATYDGANLILYRNGEVVAITPGIGTMIDNSNQAWFGYEPVGAVNFSGGVGSKLIIRDDCLSPIEIAKLAQSSALGWNRSYGT